VGYLVDFGWSPAEQTAGKMLAKEDHELNAEGSVK